MYNDNTRILAHNKSEIKIHPGANDPDGDQVNLLGGKSEILSDFYFLLFFLDLQRNSFSRAA